MIRVAARRTSPPTRSRHTSFNGFTFEGIEVMPWTLDEDGQCIVQFTFTGNISVEPALAPLPAWISKQY